MHITSSESAPARCLATLAALGAALRPPIGGALCLFVGCGRANRSGVYGKPQFCRRTSGYSIAPRVVRTVGCCSSFRLCQHRGMRCVLPHGLCFDSRVGGAIYGIEKTDEELDSALTVAIEGRRS